MSLTETVQSDMVTALKAKDSVAVSALRSLKSALHAVEIDEGTFTPERALSILNKEIKTREDSFSAYQSAGRKDLANQEQAEIEVLKKYQPAQLSDEEVRAKVHAVVEAAAVKEFGPLMGQAMAAVQGQAGGKQVQQILKEILHA